MDAVYIITADDVHDDIIYTILYNLCPRIHPNGVAVRVGILPISETNIETEIKIIFKLKESLLYIIIFYREISHTQLPCG